MLDPVDLSDQLRKVAQIRQKRLELQYQHNLIRTKLELLLGRPLGQRAGGNAEAVAVPAPQPADGARSAEPQQGNEPRRLRPAPEPAERASPEEEPREPAPSEPQARKWSPERGANDDPPPGVGSVT